VIAASGTFGFGRELCDVFDLSMLGGISSKGITPEPRRGNPPPRIAETASGMLNSVGLQNPGLERFLEVELPYMLALGTTVIANIAGNTVEDYQAMCRRLDDTLVDVIELNLSCPNVKEGCMAFGSTHAGVLQLVRSVRPLTGKPLWVKLTPNTLDIRETAMAAEAAGADAVSLVNTLLGMAIDIRTRRPILRNNTGGLSGPAIKPIALRMVQEAYKAVGIPIIGMGGIMTWEDAVEFLLAGASAVQIGTANLVNPTACRDVINGLREYAADSRLERISSLTGALRLW
jgi:dihydroorotate dehydrogenase (NAD+) catalytic subunit